MTNEEAVRLLRRIQDPEAWEPQINGAAFEALEMAIEALGRQQAAGSGNLISRQAAIDTLENTKTAISENGERYIAKQNAIMRIDALPSAEPKRGKWVDDGDPLMLTCGNCGYAVMRYNNTPFCPNCGAKMEVTPEREVDDE